jgi:hypothetical protein
MADELRSQKKALLPRKDSLTRSVAHVERQLAELQASTVNAGVTADALLVRKKSLARSLAQSRATAGEDIRQTVACGEGRARRRIHSAGR